MTMTEITNSNDAGINLRWKAVLENDQTFDGAFIYAVVTTGVYCRPSCPSRTPRPENVRYFPSTAGATDAGFRACRRCRPDEAATPDPAVEAIVGVCRALEDPTVEFDVAEAAEASGWSVRQMQRRFKELVGVSVSSYRRSLQAEAARVGLRGGHDVLDAAFGAGYGSARAFYEHGAPRLGMAPSDYRSRATGRSIALRVAESALGLVLVATTDNGVCAVRLGDDRDALIAEVRAEFSNAQITEISDAAPGSDLIDAVVALAEGRRADVALPLDVQGTAFQELVWEHLQTIPPGTTQTYGEVAAAIGRASSFRAVANACGANPVALVVPCHRVVRSDGGHGGYRWGEDRKRLLLAAEAGV